MKEEETFRFQIFIHICSGYLTHQVIKTSLKVNFVILGEHTSEGI